MAEKKKRLAVVAGSEIIVDVLIWDEVTLDSPDGRFVIATDGLPALAALCLYQQSFGFSHEDVAELRDLAKCWDEEAKWSDEFGGHTAYRAEMTDRGVWGKNAESCRRRAGLAQSLASRIASLLPPEAP